MKKATIHDVARIAGVGVGTVSRVLNDSEQVKEETRMRVLEAMASLGYKPDTAARQMRRKQRRRVIGIITRPFLNYQSFAERLRGVQRVLDQLPHAPDLVLFSTDSLRHFERRLAAVVEERHIDGLLIIDLNLSEEQKDALNDSGVPFVGINHSRDTDWHCLGTNNVQGGLLATRALLEHGHRRIAYVGDWFDDAAGFRTSGERYEGYCRALAEYGVQPCAEWVLQGDHGYEVAYAMAEQLLKLPQQPSAIFAMSDMQAIGCIAAIQAAGKDVPQDYSVIGYDDLEISYHMGLTTIRQHLELSGAEGMRHLLALMDGIISSPPALPPLELIWRGTVRDFS